METRKPATDKRPAPSADEKEHPPAPGETEVGGRGGAEPTRYGDWEVNGICTDF